MKTYDTIIIGQVSINYNIDKNNNQTTDIGGAVIYASAAAKAQGSKVGVVTKLAVKDKHLLDNFVIPNKDIYFIPSAESTTIRNVFLPDKDRESTALSQADAFTIDDIPFVRSKIYHIAGSIYGDFDSELIKYLAPKGKIAVDVSALLRRASGAINRVYLADWEEKKYILPYIDYLKTNIAEANKLTGFSDPQKAAQLIHNWGAKEIMITSDKEILVYDGNTFYCHDIKPNTVEGQIGRGDTAFAAYITERLQHDMEKSLLFATAMVCDKMGYQGPYRGDRKSVENYLEGMLAK